MAGKKYPKFTGYKERPKPKKAELKVPKVYLINGYYYVGEDLAEYCKQIGMKVEEI